MTVNAQKIRETIGFLGTSKAGALAYALLQHPDVTPQQKQFLEIARRLTSPESLTDKARTIVERQAKAALADAGDTQPAAIASITSAGPAATELTEQEQAEQRRAQLVTDRRTYLDRALDRMGATR